jgi:hypothetical protein
MRASRAVASLVAQRTVIATRPLVIDAVESVVLAQFIPLSFEQVFV